MKMVHPKGRKGREEPKIVQPRTLGASNSKLQKIQEARKNLLWTVDVFWLVIPSENVPALSASFGLSFETGSQSHAVFSGLKFDSLYQLVIFC